MSFLVPILITAAAVVGAILGRDSKDGDEPPHRPPPPQGGDKDERWLKDIHPDAAACFRKVLAQVRTEGFDAFIVSGKRSCEAQKKIYQQGRSLPGAIVTHADGCKSWHVQGRAIDLNFPKGQEGGYKRAGEICKGLGGKWGGDFAGFFDGPHLEYHPGLTIEQVCPVASDCGNLGLPMNTSITPAKIEQVAGDILKLAATKAGRGLHRVWNAAESASIGFFRKPEFMVANQPQLPFQLDHIRLGRDFAEWVSVVDVKVGSQSALTGAGNIKGVLFCEDTPIPLLPLRAYIAMTISITFAWRPDIIKGGVFPDVESAVVVVGKTTARRLGYLLCSLHYGLTESPDGWLRKPTSKGQLRLPG